MNTLLTRKAANLCDLIREEVELISIDGSNPFPFSEAEISEEDMYLTLIEGDAKLVWNTPKHCTQRFTIFLKGWDK